MRVLLDESLPHDWIEGLSKHDISTVRGMGWAGVENGELLRRASGKIDAFVTMDRKLEVPRLERVRANIRAQDGHLQPGRSSAARNPRVVNHRRDLCVRHVCVALASTSYPTWAKIGVGLGCIIAWADVVVQYVERRRTEGRADPLPVATPATLPMLHRFLGIGLLTLAAALLLLKYFGIAPGLRADSATRLTAYSLSAVAVVLATVALIVFKPRVPERPTPQPVEEYWATPEVGTKVLPVWFLLEGAGTLAVVAYFLTGEPVAAVAAGVLIAAFWWCGPNVFAKE